MFDRVNNSSSGLITWVPNNVFVSAVGTGPSGMTDSNIDRAIDAIGSGGVVNIEAGTFAQGVTIDRAVTLIGSGDGSVAGAGATVIAPSSGTAVAVTATSGSVTIENLQIAGPGSAAGILLGTAGSAVTVSQNTITGNGTGIWVDGGDLASATQNFITGNGVGIQIDSGTVGTFTENSISGNTTARVHNRLRVVRHGHRQLAGQCQRSQHVAEHLRLPTRDRHGQMGHRRRHAGPLAHRWHRFGTFHLRASSTLPPIRSRPP